MTIVLQHRSADVARNSHDRLLARLTLGHLGDACLPQAVKADFKFYAYVCILRQINIVNFKSCESVEVTV
jgi:hypothetical protein